MKRLFSILVVAILGLAQNVFAQNGVRASYKTDINIISVNDMHAAIDNMPKMAAIVDSLRAMDKSSFSTITPVWESSANLTSFSMSKE